MDAQTQIDSARVEAEAEALARYRQSQQDIQERTQGYSDELPEGYDDDGIPLDSKEPEPILGKFKSQDELVKAYQELEKKLGQPKEEPKPTPTETKQEEVMVQGVNVSQYDTEYRTNGNLSDKSYQELAKLGFSKDDVNRYIEGQNALAEKFTSSIYSKAGGEEAYFDLIQWSATNLPSNTIQEYNDALSKGDVNKINQLIEYAQLKRGVSTERQPNRVEGTATSDGGGLKPFANKAEWQQATANRLYGKDVKYTTMIDKRFLLARQKGFI